MPQPLVCPACGTGGGPSDRFCPRCGSPFVLAPGVAGRAPPREDEATARARKIHPPYADGEPVRVATAQNQPEAELVQGLLLEAGIPSLVRRSGGFDVPDFLAAGPRDVLVPRGGEAAARELLGTRAPPAAASREPAPLWVRTLALVACGAGRGAGLGRGGLRDPELSRRGGGGGGGPVATAASVPSAGATRCGSADPKRRAVKAVGRGRERPRR